MPDRRPRLPTCSSRTARRSRFRSGRPSGRCAARRSGTGNCSSKPETGHDCRFWSRPRRSRSATADRPGRRRHPGCDPAARGRAAQGRLPLPDLPRSPHTVDLDPRRRPHACQHGRGTGRGDAARTAGDIVVESGRLDRMLTNLLNLTAIMAGRFVANTEPVPVGPLARQVAPRGGGTRAGPHVRRRHSSRSSAGGGRPCPAGPGAAQPLRERGQIRPAAVARSARPRPLAADTVTIRITDQGIGIAPDQVGRSSSASIARRPTRRCAGWGWGCTSAEAWSRHKVAGSRRPRRASVTARRSRSPFPMSSD